jgi:hypothetical protein
MLISVELGGCVKPASDIETKRKDEPTTFATPLRKYREPPPGGNLIPRSMEIVALDTYFATHLRSRHIE